MIRRCLIALALLVGLATAAVSLPGGADYASLDRYALAAPTGVETSVDSLAQYLCRRATTPTQRARVIYRWITARIRYDVQALSSGQAPDQSAAAVLRRRTAVCDGYSRLYEALAKASGLEVARVVGDCRTLQGQASARQSHAWNAVKLEGRWRLLDSTWGSGSLDKSGRFQQAFDEHYFLTPPEQLIFTHFPSDSRWQLLSPAISRDTFENYPVVSSHYFQYGIRARELHGFLKADEGCRLTFDVPARLRFTARLEKDGRELADGLTFTQRDPQGRLLADALFPASGEYRMNLYATDQSAAQTLPLCVQYRLKVGRPSREPAFPTATGTFSQRNCTVDYPLVSPLRAGRPTPFSVRVPGAEAVAVICQEQFLQLERQGGADLWKGAVPLRPGQAVLAARFPGDSNYWHLLRYQVGP